jgi:flagellar basal-body rod protein FlgB
MIEALFRQTNYEASKKLLDATVMRHEAIAANIANIETPGYKRVDLAPTFAAELRRAVASKSDSQIAGLAPRLEVDGNAVASNRDGNSVQLESELLQLQQNTLTHALEVQFISGSLSKLRMAITGHSG